MKTKNIERLRVLVKKSSSTEKDSKKSKDKRPECPYCGNKHLNIYLTSLEIWKCSRKQCRSSFDKITKPLNPAA